MKNKKRGKQRLPIIESPIYSRYFFEIAIGNNYPQKIYESWNKEKGASIISRQLDILEKKENFLFSEIKEDKTIFPMQKIRVYSINWDKIIEEFFNFYSKKMKGLRGGPNLIKSFQNEWFLLLKDEPDSIKPLLGPFQNNDITKDFFKKIFESIINEEKEINLMNSNVKKIETIKEIFESIPIIFMTSLDSLKDNTKDKIKDKIKKNKQFKEFFKIIFLSYYTYYNYINILAVQNGVIHLFDNLLKIN